MQSNYNGIMQYKMTLCRANKKSVGCHVTWSGGLRYLVQTSAGGFELVVDLIARTCACKKWQLSGIPCFHAVACLNSHEFNLEDYVHRCYSVNMFKKVNVIACLLQYTYE